MRAFPKSVVEVDDNFRWVIDSYLKLIEEFACDPRCLRYRRADRRGGERARSLGRRAGGWGG